MRDYIIRIDYIDAQHNAPEYANMEVEYDDYQNELIFIRLKEKPLYDDVLLEVQERSDAVINACCCCPFHPIRVTEFHGVNSKA